MAPLSSFCFFPSSQGSLKHIKMKTKLISFLLMLLVSLTTFAQQQQKKVAVYVTGQESGISKVLGDQLVAAFAKSGKYIAIERTASFLAELSKEHSYQRTGAVSDNEISRLGIQFGVHYVCVVDLSDVFGQKYVSARLIDVERAQVINTANAQSSLSTMEELMKVCNNLKSQLFGGSLGYSSVPQGYVDLGLPSGTMWKEFNANGFYTYDDAVSQFGKRLPTKEQWEELRAECQWSWTGGGCKITGPNGNSITLPAAGRFDCDGRNGCEHTHGDYWSSSPAWSLGFYSQGAVTSYMQDTRRCYRCSVRLVYNRR